MLSGANSTLSCTCCAMRQKKNVPGQLKLDLCCGAELMAVAFMESDRSVLKAQTRDFALAGIRVSAAFKSTLVAT